MLTTGVAVDLMFQSCMKKVEQEVHQSFLKCQEQMSSLLTAVHHQRYCTAHRYCMTKQEVKKRTTGHQMSIHLCRLLLLKNFEKNVLDQLKKLEENSTHLNQMNAHIKVETHQIQLRDLNHLQLSTFLFRRVISSPSCFVWAHSVTTG